MTHQLVDELLNTQQYIRIPLAESIQDLGINLIKRECGFPDNWSHIDIGTWLSEYDYIPFTRIQMQRQDPYGVIGHYLSTNYDADVNRWQIDNADIIWINLPIDAFNEDVINHIANLLVGPNFQISDYEAWTRYLLLGGPDRIRIGVRRYNPNINLIQPFQTTTQQQPQQPQQPQQQQQQPQQQQQQPAAASPFWHQATPAPVNSVFSTAPQPFQSTTQQQPAVASPFWHQATPAPVPAPVPAPAPAAALPPPATLNERFMAAAQERARAPKVLPFGRS